VLKKLYRITGIKKTQDQKCSLTLVEYREEVYADDNNAPAFGTSVQTELRAMQPRDVELVEKNVKRAGGAIEKTVLITFTPSTATDYRRVDVWYKVGGAASAKDWKRAGCTSGSAFTVHNLERGTTYTIALLPVDVYGNILRIKKATTHVIKISGTKRAGDLCCDDGTSIDTLKASVVTITLDEDGDIVTTGGGLFEYTSTEMTPTETGEYDTRFELNENGDIQPLE